MYKFLLVDKGAGNIGSDGPRNYDREVYWAEARAMSQVWGGWGTSTTVYCP
jgi:hypothetical protein